MQDPQEASDDEIRALLDRLAPHIASISGNIAGLDKILSATREVAGALLSLRKQSVD